MFDLSPLGSDGQESTEFIWRDYFGIMFLVSAGLLAIVLLLVNEPKEDESVDIQSPGSVIVELVWDSERNVDLDLWVQAPGDKPVGYSNMSGVVFNLLRDDLGTRNDMSGINLENAYSRGTPAGEYCVNVHYYNDHDGSGPLKCKVMVRVKESLDSPAKPVVATELTMKSSGQETTAFRFRLTEDGKLVPGSIHSIDKPLRSAHLGG